MADGTKIGWTDATWNPVTGCSKVSAGCKNCYAERDWPRLSAPRPKPNIYTGRKFNDVRCHPERLDQPLRWMNLRRIFVNSMSDLFHPNVPLHFISRVFAAMALSPNHTFQVLTKRPYGMADYCRDVLTPGEVFRAADKLACDLGLSASHPGATYLDGGAASASWPLPNVWLGVSVENQAAADERIPVLLQTPAAVRWISAEPLIGPISRWLVPMDGAWVPSLVDSMPGRPSLEPSLDWVVIGGESGPKARPMAVRWVRDIITQCRAAGVPVFVKQMGARIDLTGEMDWPTTWPTATQLRTPGKTYWRLNNHKGADMDEWPADLRIQEWPYA